MRTLYPWFLSIACFAFVLNCSGQTVSQSGEAIDGSQKASFTAPASPTSRNESASELPDSPGVALLAQQASSQSQPGQSSDNPAPPSGNVQGNDQKPQRPVGTAAAEAPKVSGITAAQPAGVAIAPAKQKRKRTIVLKVGAIIGAGAAVGTVIALTAGTSSKPPGAH
jgi:hypothetical protein